MEHREVKGVLPMRSGMKKGSTCTCGWHSHTKTIEQHIEEEKNK